MVFRRLTDYDVAHREIATARTQNICEIWYKDYIQKEGMESVAVLLDRLSYQEDHSLTAWVEEEEDLIFQRYSKKTDMHGADHALRVCALAWLLGKSLKLGDSDLRLLLFTALYHDIGRTDDSPDPYHGFRGARMIPGISHPFSQKEEQLIRAVIAAHPFQDKDADDLLSFLGNFDGEEKNRFQYILAILKDADALDRFRLSDHSLRVEYLRFTESHSLIPIACELVQLTCRKKEESSTAVIDWDSAADYYGTVSRLSFCYAVDQLKEAGIEPGTTLLDVGAGCGRYSLAAAGICRHVTAFDQSRKMLDYCRKWCGENGITNVETIQGEWTDPEAVRRLGMFDYVLASRTPAMQDIDRLSALAVKKVILINWANAPSFPDLTVSLCGRDNLLKYPLGTPVRLPRQLGYNCYFREAYKAGFEPNIRILSDGFCKEYDCREDANRDLSGLVRGNVRGGCEDRILRNFERFYEVLPGGRVRICLESKAAVLWWNI